MKVHQHRSAQRWFPLKGATRGSPDTLASRLAAWHHFIPTAGIWYFSVCSDACCFLECFSHVSTAQMLKFWSLAGDRWRAGGVWAHSSLLRVYFFSLKPPSKFLSWAGEHPCIKHEENIIFEFLCLKDVYSSAQKTVEHGQDRPTFRSDALI